MSATDPTAGERECCWNYPHAAHETPCTPAEPDAGDVEALRLTHAERESLRPVLTRYARWESARVGPVFETVEAIITARLDAVRRKAGDERAEQIAQAIEAIPYITKFGYVPGEHIKADAARIARESR